MTSLGHSHSHSQIELDFVVDACAQREFRDDADSATSFALLGEHYRRLLDEMRLIVEYQWERESRGDGVKGFLLSGPPGVGKTMLGKRLAFELGKRAQDRPDPHAVALAMLDGGQIARPKYGESEARIRAIFAQAHGGFGVRGRRSILVFDDVESILMSRDGQHAKEWHFSQDSVFFHVADELDTSRAAVVLTTNRPDLVDMAIRDRFLEYRIEYPAAELLVAVAVHAARGRIAVELLPQLSDRVSQAAASGKIRSMRDAQRFVMAFYVETIIGAASMRRAPTE